MHAAAHWQRGASGITLRYAIRSVMRKIHILIRGFRPPTINNQYGAPRCTQKVYIVNVYVSFRCFDDLFGLKVGIPLHVHEARSH